MTPIVYALDEPHGATLDEAKALVGGKAANLGVMARDLGLPVPPGFVDHDGDLPGRSWPSGWPDGLDDEIRARDGRGRGGGRAAVRRPGRPAARQRPLGRAGLDAGDDGHDPRPRAQRRDDGAGSRDVHRGRGVRARSAAGGSSSRFRSIVGVDGRPRGPVAAAPARDRGRLPLVEQRPRARLPREGGHPRRPRYGRDGPGDGLRQPRRRLGDRRRCSRAIRRPASPSSTATCCSTRRARTSSPARIRPSRSPRSTTRMPGVAARARAATPSDSSATTPTCATSSSRSRTAGCGCSRSGSASAARRPRCGSRSTWPRIPTSR